MSWLSWLLVVLLVVFYVLSMVLQRKQAKESFKMTVGKFKHKVDGFISKNDAGGLHDFLKSHLFFIMTHSSELGDVLNEINVKFGPKTEKTFIGDDEK